METAMVFVAAFVYELLCTAGQRAVNHNRMLMAPLLAGAIEAMGLVIAGFVIYQMRVDLGASSVVGVMLGNATAMRMGR